MSFVCSVVADENQFNIMAKEFVLKLKEGDPAPDFAAMANGGRKTSLADFKGKNVILYFYPRDNTPGCTKEACAFRDHFAELNALGVSRTFGLSTQVYRLPARSGGTSAPARLRE